MRIMEEMLKQLRNSRWKRFMVGFCILLITMLLDYSHIMRVDTSFYMFFVPALFCTTFYEA